MSIVTRYFRASLTLIAVFCWMALNAQEGSETAEEGANIEEIVVHAHPLQRDDPTLRSAVLTEEELARAAGGSIGETIERLPGVRSAGFGRAVGRPQIHGLDGPRVKVLVDRLSTMDISTNFADHTVTVEPYAAQSIEVLTGPTTLLFGSGALGGIVNVQTDRWQPTKNSDSNFDGSIQISGSDNANDRNRVARANLHLDRFRVHLGVLQRESEDFDIPGNAVSAYYEEIGHEEPAEDEHHDEEDHHEDEDHEEEHHDEHEDEVEYIGYVPNSGLEANESDFGVTFYPSDNIHVGVAHAVSDGNYGIPSTVLHHHHGEEEELHEEEHHDEDEHHDEEEEHHEEEHLHEDEGPGRIVYEQSRTDFELDVKHPTATVEKFRVRAGFSDYEHDEIEGDEISSSFLRDSAELRVDTVLLTDESAGEHLIGLHIENSDLEILDRHDNEAILPATTTTSTGIYWMGHFATGSLLGDADLGARIEYVDVDSVAFGQRDYEAFALSALFLPVEQNSQEFSLTFDVSSRAPKAEELFFNGAHVGTGSVEIGNPNLGEEQAVSITGEYYADLDVATVLITGYARGFKDYIFGTPTGEFEDDLPIFRIEQEDVSFRGIEITGVIELPSNSLFSPSLEVGYEALRARVESGGLKYLPRMPSHRLRAEVELDFGRVDVVGRVSQVADQNEFTEFEFQTDGYTDVSFDIRARPLQGDLDLEIFLKGRNLLDEEIRSHVSPIKNFVPRRGRALELGFRLNV